MNVSRLLSVPKGRGVAQATAFEIDINNTPVVPRLAPDYTEVEYLVTGRAATYAGPATGPVLRTGEEFDYVTRILVRSPADRSRFSGRVLVEPFNTSNGQDRDVLWASVGSLLESNGDAWVGVTERASSREELVGFDPVRYADIDIASNDLAWDILTQVGALIRERDSGLLAGLDVRHVYLGGYSQSGCDTATFAMAIHPHAHVEDGSSIYDGYFPAAHSGSVTRVASGAVRLPSFESVPLGPALVPVIDVETQTDVEGFSTRLRSGRAYVATGGAHVRRPDADDRDDRYRLYEVAGAPHAAKGTDCEGGGSSFPTPAFLRAGLAALFRWAETGSTPPKAPPLELISLGEVSQVRLDEHGNAIGGVRSPFVDVPLMRYEAHSGPSPKCLLVGRETVLQQQVLQGEYGDLEAYLKKFRASLDETTEAGFLLQQDKPSLLAEIAEKAQLAFAR